MAQHEWIGLANLSDLLTKTGQAALARDSNDENRFQECLKQLDEARKTLNLGALNWGTTSGVEQMLEGPWLESSIPFGAHLVKSLTKLPQKLHVLFALGAIGTLLSRDEASVPRVFGAEETGDTLAQFLPFRRELWKMAGTAEESYLRTMLPVFTLYHDLGKAIADERHPFEGYHMVNDSLELDRELFGQFKTWILDPGQPAERRADLFTRLMRYHDMWGNIATGEASLALFSTALELTEEGPDRHLTFLGCLVLTNLSDTYAPAGLFKDRPRKKGIRRSDVETILERWEVVKDIIKTKALRDPEQIWDALVAYSQTRREVIRRIYYLLLKAGIHADEDRIALMLRSACGGWFPAFCRAFGTLRLSYALRFLFKLKERLGDKQGEDELGVKILIDVLIRVVKTYESLIETYRSEGRVTGIEMASLRREETVADSIVDSLIRRCAGALSWIDDEVTAFPQT